MLGIKYLRPCDEDLSGAQHGGSTVNTVIAVLITAQVGHNPFVILINASEGQE